MTVISPTLDTISVDMGRCLIDWLRADGHPVDVVAEFTAEFLGDQVARYGLASERVAS